MSRASVGGSDRGQRRRRQGVPRAGHWQSVRIDNAGATLLGDYTQVRLNSDPSLGTEPREVAKPTARMRRSGAALLLPFPTIRSAQWQRPCCSGWRRELASVAATSTAQQAGATPSHSNEAAALQLKRIGALRHRGGGGVVIAPAAGLADGLQRKEWHLPLQGVPPFHASSTAQCARLVADGIAVSVVLHTPGVRGLARQHCSSVCTCLSVLTEVECPLCWTDGKRVPAADSCHPDCTGGAPREGLAWCLPACAGG